MEGFYLTLFDEITDNGHIFFEEEQNFTELKEYSNDIQTIDENLYSSLFDTEPLSPSNNILTTIPIKSDDSPKILEYSKETSILLTGTLPPLLENEESLKNEEFIQSHAKKRAGYIQLCAIEKDKTGVDFISPLQITNHHVEYNIEPQIWSLIMTFNLPIGDVNSSYPRELKLELYEFLTPPLKNDELPHWDLKSPYQLRLTGNFEEYILYTLSILPNSIKSRDINNEIEGKFNSKIEVKFSVNQKVSLFPYTNLQLFPHSIFAMEFPEKINIENLFDYLQFVDKNWVQIKLELSTFEEFTKQYPYYFRSRYFPRNNSSLREIDIFPQIAIGDLSWHKFKPNEKMVYFKAVNPLPDSTIRLIIKKECKSMNGDSFYEEDRVIGPYRVCTKFIISLNTEDCIEFSIPYPIAETIERTLELFTDSIKIKPPLGGEWSATNHLFFRFIRDHPLKSISCKVSFKNRITSILGVVYKLNLIYSQEMRHIHTNFTRYSPNNFPSRPQFYFEFDQLVDTESFVKGVTISTHLKRVPIILLNDDEITCPTIPLNRKKGYYVCITIGKSDIQDQIYPYLAPSTLYKFSIEECKSLEGPRSLRDPFLMNFTTCSLFTVNYNSKFFELNHPFPDNTPIAEITPSPLLPVYLDLIPSHFLPNTTYNILILEDAKSNFQLIAPYLRLEFDDLELNQKDYKISEIPAGNVIPFLRAQIQALSECGVAIQITPELPPSCKFTIVFDKIPCKQGDLLGDERRFDFYVSAELIPISWFTSFNEPYQIVFNQPLFVPGVGDLNNILLKSDTSGKDTFEYINPYYCPTITNIFGYWKYVQSHKFGELYGERKQQDQLIVNDNICDAIEFVPTKPFNQNGYYDVTIPSIKMRSYICSLKQDFTFRVQGYSPYIFSSNVLQNLYTPVFLLKFICNVDPNMVISLCDIQWDDINSNNDDHNIVDEGARLELATEDDIKRFLNPGGISQYLMDKIENLNGKKWVAIINRIENFSSYHGALVIRSGPVSQKNILPFEGPKIIPFALKSSFEYLSLEPPKSISIRMSSMISLDDDLLILLFSQVLEPVQREFPTITPEIKGSWVVEQSTLVFRPDDLWRLATLYYINVPRNIKAITGHRLAKRKKIQFNTGNPIPILKSPHQNGEIIRNQVFLIRYSQPVNIRSVIKKSFIEVGRSFPRKKIISLREATEEEYANTLYPLNNDDRIRDQSIEVLLTPVKPLPFGAEVSLEIGTGVKGFDGRGRSTYSCHWAFITRNYFHIEKVFIDNPFILNQSECIIQFSQIIGGRLKENLPLLMWNIPDLRINLKSVINNQIIFSVYTVEGSPFVSEDLHLVIDCSNIVSDDNQTLSTKDNNFMINIIAEPFIFALRTLYDHILVLNNPFLNSYNYSALSFNFKELRVIITQLDEIDILEWIHYTPEKYFSESIIKQRGDKIIFDKAIPVDNFVPNQYVVFTIDIKKLLGKLPRNKIVGLLITPSERAFYPNNGVAPLLCSIFQMAKIGLEVFNHEYKVISRVSDLTGTSDILEKAKIVAYDYQTNARVQESVTDKNGIARLHLKLLNYTRDLVILASYKNAWTILCHHFAFQYKIPRCVYIFTDKPQYLPGETICGVGFWQNSDSSLKNLESLQSLTCALKILIPNLEVPVELEIHDYSFTFKIILNNPAYLPSLFFKLSIYDHYTHNLSTAKLSDMIELKISSNRIYRNNNLNSPGQPYLSTILKAKISKNDEPLNEGNLTWKIVAKYATPYSFFPQWNNFKFGAGDHRKDEIIFSGEQISEILDGRSYLTIQFNGSPEFYFPILIEANVEDSQINFPLLPSPYLIGLYTPFQKIDNLQDINIEIITIDFNSRKLLEADVTLKVKYLTNTGDIIDEHAFDLRTSTEQPIHQQIGYTGDIEEDFALLEIIAISDYDGYRSFTEFQITLSQQNIIFSEERIVETNQDTILLESHPAINHSKLEIITESNDDNQYFGPITITQSQENAFKTFNGIALTFNPFKYSISRLSSFSEYTTNINENFFPQSMIHTIVTGSKEFITSKNSQLIPSLWTGSVEVNVIGSKLIVSINPPGDIMIEPGTSINIGINVIDQYGNAIKNADISLFVTREESSWDPTELAEIDQDIAFSMYKKLFTEANDYLLLASNRSLINIDDLESVIEKRKSEIDHTENAQTFLRFPVSNAFYKDKRIVTPESLYFDILGENAFLEDKSKLLPYHAFIIVYSVADAGSLDNRVINVLDWIRNQFPDIPMPAILVSNNSGANRREIADERGLAIANRYSIPFIEISQENYKTSYRLIYERLKHVMKIKLQRNYWIGMISHSQYAAFLRNMLTEVNNQQNYYEISVEAFHQKIFAPQNNTRIHFHNNKDPFPIIKIAPKGSKKIEKRAIRRKKEEFSFHSHLKTEEGTVQTSINLEKKGKYKLIVIANNCKQYGSATASISVQSFIQHRFIHPKFLTISDQSEFNFELENSIDQNVDLTIGFRSMNDAIALEKNHLGYSLQIGSKTKKIIKTNIKGIKEGLGSLQIIFKFKSNYSESFLISIPVNQPITNLQNQIYRSIPESKPILENLLIIPDHVDNYGYLEFQFGNEIFTPILSLTRKFLKDNYYRTIENISSILLLVTYCLQSQDDQTKIWENFSIKSSKEEWFKKMVKLLNSRINREINNQSISFDLPHALISLANLSQFFDNNINNKVDNNVNNNVNNNNWIKSKIELTKKQISDRLLNFISGDDQPISVGDKVIKCYSIFALYINSPSLVIKKIAIQFIQFYSHYSEIPIECFGWLLPVIFRSSDGVNLDLFSPLIRNIILEISSYLEHSLVKLDDGRSSFFNSYDRSSQTLLYQTSLRSDVVIFNGLIKSFGAQNALIDQLHSSIFNNNNNNNNVNYINIQEASWISIALNSLQSKTNQNLPKISLSINDTIFLQNNTENYKRIKVSFDSINSVENANHLVVSKEDGGKGRGNGKFCFFISAKYLPKFLGEMEISNRGIIITRSYHSMTSSDNQLQINKMDRVEVKLNISVLLEEINHIRIIDHFPASFKFIGSHKQINGWIDNEHVQTDGVDLFVSQLKRGDYQYSYYAKALFTGTFLAPPSSVHLIYRPNFFSYSSFNHIIVI